MTDIEASTHAWNTSPDETDTALSRLDTNLTAIVAAHDGSVVKARGEGDSHFAVFSEASRAIVAAAALQRRSDSHLPVRACVVIGETHPRGGDYVGGVINHAARIRSVAHGGQTVTTRSVVDVASSRLPDDLTFRSLGVHRVHDIPAPLELFQLYGPGLGASFPPLRTRAFDASAMMAVVVVDEVGSSRRLEEDDSRGIGWQRQLIQTMRTLSDTYDGRHLKLMGDGCMVAFEDPRTALEFAAQAQARGTFRVGVAVGLIDVIEGELAGRTVFDAYSLMRSAGPGELHACEVTRAVCSRVT